MSKINFKKNKSPCVTMVCLFRVSYSPVSHSDISSWLCKKRKETQLGVDFFWRTAASQLFDREKSWKGCTKYSFITRNASQMYTPSYQRYGIDSVESTNTVLQLLTWKPTEEIADGANAAHEDVYVHPRLQTQREKYQLRMNRHPDVVNLKWYMFAG